MVLELFALHSSDQHCLRISNIVWDNLKLYLVYVWEGQELVGDDVYDDDDDVYGQNYC